MGRITMIITQVRKKNINPLLSDVRSYHTPRHGQGSIKSSPVSLPFPLSLLPFPFSPLSHPFPFPSSVFKLGVLGALRTPPLGSGLWGRTVAEIWESASPLARAKCSLWNGLNITVCVYFIIVPQEHNGTGLLITLSPVLIILR